MTSYYMGAPGYVVRPERYGPEVFENIGALRWTDQQGLSRGWGTTFRGRANAENWFHFPITTPTGWSATARRVQCNSVAVTLDLQPNDAFLRAINVWDGPDLFFQRDGLNVTGNYSNRQVADENQFDFNDRTVDRAIGISILVSFVSVADVTFTGVVAVFHD